MTRYFSIFRAVVAEVAPIVYRRATNMNLAFFYAIGVKL